MFRETNFYGAQHICLFCQESYFNDKRCWEGLSVSVLGWDGGMKLVGKSSCQAIGGILMLPPVILEPCEEAGYSSTTLHWQRAKKEGKNPL